MFDSVTDIIIFVVISIVVPVHESVDLEVDTADVFPYPANKSFVMHFIPKYRGSKLFDHVSDTMVIDIKSKYENVLERAIFDYGFKDMIDQTFKGDYITIPIWSRDTVSMSMVVHVLFTRKANNETFEVYQISANDQAERRRKLSDLSLANLIYKDRISLLLPPRIELKILSSDLRLNELMQHEIGTATCRAFDGLPLVEPVFFGLKELDVKDNKFYPKTNERKVKFMVSLFDHEKSLRCKAGETTESSIIRVLHHPTQVTLEPEPDRLLENGTTITCLKADGYPSPSIRWTFVSGPQNASLFFSLSDGDTKFHLSKKAPLQSMWTLNCSASNNIPGSSIVYNRTVAFIVGRSKEGLFQNFNLTAQLIIGVVIVGAIVLFCVMIVVIICIVRRCCLSDSSSNNNRKNGVPNKTASKEKGLESEQMILLPPGAPPNYIDLSNPGAGLPPPPPDYELMITDDTKRIAKSLQEEDVSANYNEVTYAELNTSNLPMKNSPSPQMSCGDDQVIYSQIVGTVTNPYSSQRSYSDTENV